MKDLKAHVERYHPKILSLIETEQENGRNAVDAIKQHISSYEKTLEKKLTLEKCYSNVIRKESVISEMISRMAWVCDSGLSFNAVTGPLFEQWVNEVRSLPKSENLISIKTLQNNALPVLEDILSSQTLNSLQSAEVVSIAFDGWDSADGTYWLVVSSFLLD
jgi:hypothetical protein